MDNNKKIIHDAFVPVLKAFSALSPDRTEFTELSILLEKLEESMTTFRENLPSSLTLLSKFGWYISWDTIPGRIMRYAKELQNGNPELVDPEIISEIDNDIDRIERTLTHNFPHRRKPILAAIKAHKDSQYYLSVPVFFAQTEGICNEITGVRFFKTKNGIPSTSNWTISFATDTFTGLLLEPMKNLAVSTQLQDPGNPTGLNRHDVMHGDSYDYGEDKTNSYKALSLLLYVGEIIYDSNQKKKDLYQNFG
jgi:hypothetical protein